MPSKSQRFGYGAKYGTAQSSVPAPTNADLAATVYRLTYQHHDTGTRGQFCVLAVDPTQAELFGRLRLNDAHENVQAAVLVSCEPMTHAECGFVLDVETADEYTFRQQAWRERQAG